jgi:hypothetical protein
MNKVAPVCTPSQFISFKPTRRAILLLLPGLHPSIANMNYTADVADRRLSVLVLVPGRETICREGIVASNAKHRGSTISRVPQNAKG